MSFIEVIWGKFSFVQFLFAFDLILCFLFQIIEHASFYCKIIKVVKEFFQEVVVTCVESGQPSQLFQLYEFDNNLQSFYSFVLQHFDNLLIFEHCMQSFEGLFGWFKQCTILCAESCTLGTKLKWMVSLLAITYSTLPIHVVYYKSTFVTFNTPT
jgi:hypothetical protein